MWLVLCLEKQLTVVSNPPGDWQRDMAMSWADGQIGALPVFNDEKAARAYAAGRYDVIRIEPGKPADTSVQ